MKTTIKQLRDRRCELIKDMENYIREVILSQPDQRADLVLGHDEDPEDEKSYPIVTTLRNCNNMSLGISSVYLNRNQICISGFDIGDYEEKDCCSIYPEVYPDILDFLAKVLSLE